MSVLVDTSVWVDHLRSNEPHLVELLKAGNVHVHGLVIGTAHEESGKEKGSG